MTLDYGRILGQAWQITWKHKILWIFGILAGLGSGGSNGGGNDGGQSNGQGGNLPPQFDQFFQRTDQSIIIAIVLGLVCLAVIVAIILIALQVIGRGGLIGGVRLAAASQAVTFGAAWQIGLQKFWTLFLIGIIPGLIGLLTAILVVVPGVMLSALTFGLGLLCLFPVLCVLAIAGAVLSIIAYFGQIAAIVENLGVADALRRAGAVLQANLGSIVVLGLIVVVIDLVAGFLLALPLGFALAPIFVSVLGFANSSQVIGYGGLAFGLLCCSLLLPVILVLQGILQTWNTAVWTLAYDQLTRPAAPPVV